MSHADLTHLDGWPALQALFEELEAAIDDAEQGEPVEVEPVRAYSDCGSPDNPHVWVMIVDKNNVPRTVCMKCSAPG